MIITTNKINNIFCKFNTQKEYLIFYNFIPYGIKFNIYRKIDFLKI
jgi:hypothetical protein